jgi:choline-sulfatase
LLSTLCDLAGVPIPAHSSGRSLAPVLRGEKEGVYESIYLQLGDWRAVRAANSKLVTGSGWATDYLFRLDRDPTEMRNIVADPAHAGELAHLRSALADWTARTTA